MILREEEIGELKGQLLEDDGEKNTSRILENYLKMLDGNSRKESKPCKLLLMDEILQHLGWLKP